MVEIAVLGHGVVGSGVLEVITTHEESLERRAKEKIHVKRILDLRKFDDLPYKDIFTDNFDDILNDDEIKIVVEVMGGLNPAFEYVKACLENGKSVVTSNKELVAAKGDILLEIAQRNNLNFLFEASVGGGIPIIRPISQCLAANDVSEIAGILNGTTNFILTKMIKDKMSFEDALKLAKELGYAERNPAADVEGHDACRKICILASLVFGSHVYPDSVYTEGITNITLNDVGYATAWGGVIKLLGEFKMLENGKLHIGVSPMFVNEESQLAHVDDVFNGILVRGDSTGDVMFYGKGAGKLPTASAVIADVIDCVKHFKARKYLYWDKQKDNYVEDYKSEKQDFFIAIKSKDIDKAFKIISDSIFKDNYSERIIRKHSSNDEGGFIVNEISLNEIESKISELSKNNIELVSRIKISDF